MAVVSYDGEVVFGINADRRAMADLDVLSHGIERSLAELRRLVRHTQKGGRTSRRKEVAV